MRSAFQTLLNLDTCKDVVYFVSLPCNQHPQLTCGAGTTVSQYVVGLWISSAEYVLARVLIIVYPRYPN
jgi:hypothetical protein